MIKTSDYFKGVGEQFAGSYEKFLDLLPDCYQFSVEDKVKLNLALQTARKLHEGQLRKSKEPYVNHPISVGSLLASYGFDVDTVSAAFLHDAFEDTDYTWEECCAMFGPEVANLVESVTKIGQNTNLETRLKIIERSEKDLRTMAIKASDRLHNMYTLDVMLPHKQKRTAEETKGFYVPVCEILGINKLRNEYQDLCLFYLDQEEFLNIYDKRNELKRKYNILLKQAEFNIQDELSKCGISMKPKYRIRNVGGIYDDEAYKLSKSMHPNEVKKLLAINMRLDNEEHCYKTLDLITKKYKVDEETIKDFIKNPKDSGYSAINLDAVIEDTDVQFRIFTKEMERKNDLGVFAHNPIDEKAKVYAKNRLEEFQKTL